MKIHLLFLFTVILLSCSKQHKLSEFADGKGNGIVGKWKLVLQGKNDAEKENYYVSFDSTGAVTASDFSCSGTFTFDEKGNEDPKSKNLVVSFTNCVSNAPTVWYSIKGAANARLENNDNTLVLNNFDCDEGCSRTFRRLK
ncbi:hypothetical protein LL912_12405 [Niabella sp. CC-SYL272]|uniref:hypothetical protein n=1 Tax=Niabella agricola TaxID=2891571 RepID=UPI001F198616|nr:hypothetical protein [Niabella agricola]MCF3109574.1 hypothetical protein [Niabella agricola]